MKFSYKFFLIIFVFISSNNLFCAEAARALVDHAEEMAWRYQDSLRQAIRDLAPEEWDEELKFCLAREETVGDYELDYFLIKKSGTISCDRSFLCNLAAGRLEREALLAADVCPTVFYKIYVTPMLSLEIFARAFEKIMTMCFSAEPFARAVNSIMIKKDPKKLFVYVYGRSKFILPGIIISVIGKEKAQMLIGELYQRIKDIPGISWLNIAHEKKIYEKDGYPISSLKPPFSLQFSPIAFYAQGDFCDRCCISLEDGRSVDMKEAFFDPLSTCALFKTDFTGEEMNYFLDIDDCREACPTEEEFSSEEDEFEQPKGPVVGRRRGFGVVSPEEGMHERPEDFVPVAPRGCCLFSCFR